MDVINEQIHPRWQERWSAGLAIGEMFDTGTPSPALVKEIEEGRVPAGKALVPGCGRGYDVLALAAPDRVALGIELSETAVESALAFKADNGTDTCTCPENARIEQGNFFNVKDTFDFVYDYTFLCALDPSVREDWAEHMARLVKPGGLLMTLIFPINPARPANEGPPFPVTLDLLEELLVARGFEKLQLEMLPAALCHKGRDGSTGYRIEAASGIGRWKRK